MAGGLEFDVSEFSGAEYVSAVAAGACPFVAIPAFPSRVFRHGFICVNRRSGIAKPKDLEGKRVGVPLYTQTAAVFIRGILQHDYGVDLAKIHWVQSAMNHGGTHGKPTVAPLVKPIPIELNETAKTLSDLLAEGSVDAILGATLPDALGQHPDVVRLFPDFEEVEKDHYRRTKIFPIMHTVVIRRDVYERHPFVASSLYKALWRAKAVALKRMRQLGALPYMLPWLARHLAELDAVFGDDPWPYGLEANRPTLEALVTYLHEQGMIKQPMPLEDLFVPVHMEL
jgi:4,5-dihydroxyphthalate decarboxylase